jgi:D-alanine-D-alanine ligase
MVKKAAAKKKLRIGVLFGGRSGEHEVSLLSAASILSALDRRKYEVIPIGISKQGRFLMDGDAQRLLTGEVSTAPHRTLSADDPELLVAAAVLRSGEPLEIPGSSLPPIDLQASAGANPGRELTLVEPSGSLDQALDCVFPVLHGTFGEDGTIQGLLELTDLAYVGSGVLGSATGMDKDAMKRLFAAAGLPQTPHITLLRSEWRADPTRCRKQIERSLAYPLFVKPANLGSSVGISKVHHRAELAPALDLAASFDRKLIVEQGVGGPGAKPRELEIAVLGNDSPEASIIGEIVPAKEFYDYEAKYQLSGPDESVAIIPARLTAAQQKQIRSMALAAFRACDCAGLARVDFLMEPASRTNPRPAIFLNEINTMPGFTSISMYPKLWQASGLSYRELIDRLIQLALERHREKQSTAFVRQ